MSTRNFPNPFVQLWKKNYEEMSDHRNAFKFPAEYIPKESLECIIQKIEKKRRFSSNKNKIIPFKFDSNFIAFLNLSG